jgi:hypothetical protein
MGHIETTSIPNLSNSVVGEAIHIRRIIGCSGDD